MSKKYQMGIVSSFDTLCGNATYSEALAKGLEEKGISVKRIVLPPDLRKNYSSEIRAEILKQIQECEQINFQVELGLYGPTPLSGAEFLAKLIKHAPDNSTATIHRVERPKKYSKILKDFGLSKNFVVKASRNAYLKRSYRLVFDELRNKKISCLTHTPYDCRSLKKIWGVDSTCHPIMWPQSFTKDFVDNENQSENRDRVVGLFGFVSSYKNFEIVVEAVKYINEYGLLPYKLRLLICGGTHPESPEYGRAYLDNYKDRTIIYKHKKNGEVVHSNYQNAINYSFKISEMIISNRMVAETCWISGADDYLLAEKIHEVDICCVPYSETGQGGSGIASQCIQFAKRILMADTRTVEAHQSMCTKRISTFDSQSLMSCISALVNEIQKDQIMTPRFLPEYKFDKILELMQKSY